MGVDRFEPGGTPLVAVEDGWVRYATPGAVYDCAAAKATSRGTVSIRGQSGYVYYYGHLDTIAGHGRPAGRERVR